MCSIQFLLLADNTPTMAEVGSVMWVLAGVVTTLAAAIASAVGVRTLLRPKKLEDQPVTQGQILQLSESLSVYAVEAALSAVGINHERVARWIGDCGCDARKARLNWLGLWAQGTIKGTVQGAKSWLEKMLRS